MAKDNIIHTFTPVEALDQNIIDENTSLLHRNGSDVAVEASLRNEVVYLLRSTTPVSKPYTNVYMFIHLLLDLRRISSTEQRTASEHPDHRTIGM